MKNNTWAEEKEYQGQKVLVTFQWTDFGIGEFEFHGARGCDVSYSAEVISVTDSEKKPVEADEEALSGWEEAATTCYIDRMKEIDDTPPDLVEE